MISLKISADEANFLCLQRTQYLSILSEAYTREMQALYLNIAPHLPPTIHRSLDVGAGLAGIDAFLSYRSGHTSEIHLLDKDGIEDKPKVGWHNTVDEFGAYNSRAGARRVLLRARVPVKNIFFHTPEDFPTIQFDLVVSFLSWGFHYPASTYARQVFNVLVPGGKLILDLRKGQDTACLSELFGSSGKIFEGQKHERRIFTK